MSMFAVRIRKTWSVPLLLTFALLATGAAQAATRYVGACGAPNNATIAAAITAAAAGDTILVCSGTWNEAVTVSKNNMTIRSATGNRADVTVSNSGTPFSLSGADITLKDMTIVSTNSRAISRGWTATPSTYTFENLAITAQNAGVLIDVSGKLTFLNVNVTSSNNEAIALGWATNGAHVFDTVTASGKTYGILSPNGGVTFKDIVATSSNSDAINMGPTYDATFTNVTATASNGRGITMGSVATGKVLSFAGVTASAKEYGIYIDTSAKVTMTNVTATSSNSDAIRMGGSTNGAHVFDTVTASGKTYGILSPNGGVTFKDIVATSSNSDAINMGPTYDATFTNVTATASNGRGITMGWVAIGKTLSFAGVTASAKEYGIYIDTSVKVTMTNVTATSSNSDAINLGGATNGAHVFDTITATGKTNALYTYNGGATFKDITASATDNYAIYMRPNYDATFTSVTATSSNGAGIYMGWVPVGKTLTLTGLNVSAKTRGIFIEVSSALSIRNSVVSSSSGDAIYLGYGAQGAHVLDSLTLDAANGVGIRFEASVPSSTIGNVCVNSSQQGILVSQYGAHNVAIRGSKLVSSSYGVRTDANPTYKTTVSSSCFMKASTPRAYSNSTLHTFNGNYWQGVAGGTSYSDGNVRDNGTLASCPVTSCYSNLGVLSAHYKFDDTWGSADTLEDSSANAKHATLNGTVAQEAALASGIKPDTCKAGNFNKTGWFATASGLDINTATDGKNSVSFWMYWDGGFSTSNFTMPFSWGSGVYYDLTVSKYRQPEMGNGVIGFNTGNGDVYGVTANGLANGWHHVAAVFNNGDVTKSRLYIDGVQKTLTSYGGQYTRSASTSAGIGAGAGWGGDYKWSGKLDNLKIYKGTITSGQIAADLAETVSCADGPDHIRVFLDGNTAALTCSPRAISAIACTDSTCASRHSTDVSVTLGPGGTAATIPAGGTGTPSVSQTSAGTTAVALNASSPLTSGSPSFRCYSGTVASPGTEITGSCNVTFGNAGLEFDVPTLTAGIASGEVSVKAVKSSGTDCVPLFQNVTRTVAFWGNYQNPATGTMSVQVNGSAVETTSSPAYSSTYSLVFDATGTAKLTSVRYDDAGQMQLNARYAGSTSNTPPDGGLIVTGSDSFVVKPYGFKLTGLTCAAADKLSTATGAFCVAGGTFTGTVEAVKYDSTKTNKLGATTPNFGQESTPQTVTFATAALVNPTTAAGGTLGTFTSATGSFTGTPIRATATMIWPNVGTLTIKPTMDYLGAGDLTSDGISDSTAFAGNVGRFYPHHFSLASGSSVTAACSDGGFTYMDQPNLGITAKIEARNKVDALTSNYLFAAAGGSYTNLGTVSLVAENDNAGADLGTRISDFGTPAWTAGEYAVAATEATFSRKIDGTLDGAFDKLAIGVKVADTDAALASRDLRATTTGTCTTATDVATDCDARQIGAATKVRFGALKVDNASGSERQNLPVRVAAMYYDGNPIGWRVNTADSCTATLALAAFGSNTTAAACYGTCTDVAVGSVGSVRLRRPLAMSDPDPKLAIAAAPTPGTAVTLASGSAFVTLLSPNTGTPAAPTPGALDFILVAPAWLKANSGDGGTANTYDWNPMGRITFGVYGPATNKRKFIYFRENY